MPWSTDPETVDKNDNTSTPPVNNNETDGPAAAAQQTPQQNSAPAAEQQTPAEQPEQSSAPAQLLVCHGAKCTCDKAVDPAPKPLKVLSHNKYIINDNGENKLLATNKENALPNLNFGQCKVPNPNNPSPCSAKLEWKDYYDHVQLPGGAYVLTEKSTAICTAKGGNIKIVQHGQQAQITTQEVEKANAGSWAADGPLVTEEIIHTQQDYNNTDTDGASVKSIEPVLYNSDQPLNTPVEFKANFNNNPTDADKQGVNWIIYNTNGEPMQNRTDVGERLNVTFKQPGTYLIEAYGKKAGDKKVTKPFTVKANELGEVVAIGNSTKVRVGEPVEFKLTSLFAGLPIPGNTGDISWTVTKNSGEGTPELLNQTGPSARVICNGEANYVVAAYLNGVSKQSKVIQAIKNGIASVSTTKSSARVNDSITFTVKDQFKISPPLETEKALVKWQCTDAKGKPVAGFDGQTGEKIEHKFDQPGEYTIQPYMVKPSSKVAVKVTVAQPALKMAGWQFPEGGRKTVTGWNEPNHPYMVFEAAEDLVIDVEYGYLNKDNKATPIFTWKGIKIPANQTPDLKGHDFTPDRAKLSSAVKEGDLFYFKVISQSKEHQILNANVPQPQDKLKLVTGEQIVSIEFLKDGKPVMNAQYGDKMQCRIRTRNLSDTKINVKIYRKEARMNVDALRADTPVHNATHTVGAGGLVVFDFTLEKSWEKDYSEKLHSFYAKISETEFFGTSATLVAFKNGVPANGGKVMAGVEQVEKAPDTKNGCPRCNLPITLAQMKKIFPDGKDQTLQEACDTYNKYMKDMGMNTCWNKAHFLAQASIEVGSTFNIKHTENFNYQTSVLIDKFGAFQTKEGIKKAYLWGRNHKKDPPVSAQNRENIANWAYGPQSNTGKKNLGNTQEGDGFKYIGRGMVQITGRGNYAFANKYTMKYASVNIIDDPDAIIKNTVLAVLSSMAYWVSRNLQNISNGETDETVISKQVGTNVDWAGKKKSFNDNTSKLFLVKQCTYHAKDDSPDNSDLKIQAGIAWLKTKTIDQSVVGTKPYKVPYDQKGEKEKESGEDTMDCSELVSRYLQKIEWSKNVNYRNTSGLFDYAKQHKDRLEEHPDTIYRPKIGDIFLWKNDAGSNGHTGVVIGYNSVTDIVTTIESIHYPEQPEGMSDPLPLAGVTTLCWKRTSGHLLNHSTSNKRYTASPCRFYTPKIHYSKAKY